jgi:hypothetical protein
VDLDVFSRRPVQPLADALGKKVLHLCVGTEGPIYEAHFELATSHRRSAEAIIVGFVRLIQRLPRSGRHAWTNAYRRDFNVGIEGGVKPQFIELAITSQTLALIQSVNARLVITVYAARLPKT